MRILRISSVILFTFLMGCAHIAEFDVSDRFWQDKSAHVGILITPLPKAHSFELGQQGGVITQDDPMSRSDLDAYLGKMDLTDFNKLADSIRDELQKQNFTVKRIAGYYDITHLPLFAAESANYAERDFRQLKNKWKLDKLVVLSIGLVGVAHDYHVTDPAGEHHGYAQISGQIVNLKTNQLEWKRSVVQLTHSDVTNWDTPSNYPLLRRAVGNAFSHAQVKLFRAFLQ